jgi:uncharacterized protein YqeY
VSSDLKNQLVADLTVARKAREKLATSVLSTTLAEIKNREIELGGEADEKEVTAAVTRAIKRRREAADLMRDGGREDLAEKELAEAEILKKYLPPELSEDEVRGIIREIIAGGATQMGPVMGQLMPRLRGRFDGKAANRLVQEELAG